jgi:hypothetical protein
METVLREEDIKELREIFQVESLGELGILKLSFLPHKAGPRAGKLKLECSKQLEQWLECDFPTFFKASRMEWEKLMEQTGEKRDTFTTFWRLFTPETYRKLVKLNLGKYLTKVHDKVEQLDLWSINKHVLKCNVRWKAKFFPLLEVPEFLYVAIKPI